MSRLQSTKKARDKEEKNYKKKLGLLQQVGVKKGKARGLGMELGDITDWGEDPG